MSKRYNSKVGDYVTESGALLFINGATRPLSDGSMHRRANTVEVARKILSVHPLQIVLAHIVYGPTDIVALVHASSVQHRHTIVSRIRALRNHPEHRDNFVADAVSQPIISMYGRPPSRSDWGDRNHYCAWLLAKVSETGPADNLALNFLNYEQITFVATLTGHFDLAMFIETKTDLEFDNFIDRDLGYASSLYFSDTRILSRTQAVMV